MKPVFDWLLRGRCMRHAEPLFDRDEHGHAIFRCPRCLVTWEYLPELQPAAEERAPIVFARPAERDRRRAAQAPRLRLARPA